MKIITLKVGNILEALVDYPFSIPMKKGDRAKITGFGSQNSSSANSIFNKVAPQLDLVNDRGDWDIKDWATDVKDLFLKFKKVSK